ncbi:hypothetical protein O181_122384 [Austropuccinia psidii MF-1]|uniref:Uncharacterized protein n=1 Tax=Austropuccinia psidii MF-1 TaxID=1389203 RepID=A0A9Q3KMX0_9BASI|nr:hypothetical protein [Austropuccinia psidii MF-1]
MNLQPPMANTSRDQMSTEPESVFDHCCHWNIIGNFTYPKKMNEKVATSLFEEVDAFTEAFVDKAMKSAVTDESTRALARGEVDCEYALVVKFKEALGKF